MGELSRQQEELVRALVAAGPTPDGFDPARLRITTRVLLNKRCGAVAARMPVVRARVGPTRFAELFFEWADGMPKRSSAEEAAEFVKHLERTGHLPSQPRRRGILRWFPR